jgi:uncharacterized protein YqeY
MLRARLGEELKLAMKAKDTRRTSTLRLILAALKDREIAARGDGGPGTIGDEDVLNMLATMVRQRGESIALYRQGGREDLVRQEEEEAAIISSFLPTQLGEAEIREASQEVTAEVGASGVKDMGRVMAALKERYAGRMDFAKASSVVKALLTAD